MRNILIITDRKDLRTALSRGDIVPYGISIQATECESWLTKGSTEQRVEVKVDFKAISGVAFALWILRRLRSIPGDHRIEIGGKDIPLHMPEAIDQVATALSENRTLREMTAA